MTSPGQDQLRICVVGDELAAGVGDPKGLGWLGRVTARTHSPALTMVFPLVVPGETTTALSARWEGEFNRRATGAPEVDHRLVIALGRADVDADLSVARSRLNLANMLDVADSRRIPAFVVGPPPGADADRERLAELSVSLRGRGQPPPRALRGHLHPPRRPRAVARRPRRQRRPYPGQAGYGLMAWLVLHTGWYGWLGLPDDDASA